MTPSDASNTMTPQRAEKEIQRRWPNAEALWAMTDAENEEYARLCLIVDPDAFDIGVSQDAAHYGL